MLRNWDPELVRRFALIVPSGLTYDLLLQMKTEVMLPVIRDIAPVLQKFVDDNGLHERCAGRFSKPARLVPMFDPNVVDDAHLQGIREGVAKAWFRAIDDHRKAVEDSSLVALGFDLMPDPAVTDDESCEAFRTTIEMTHRYFDSNGTNGIERAWKIYAAFVETLRTEMADKVERLQISDTTILAIDHGRFTLERAAPASP